MENTTRRPSSDPIAPPSFSDNSLVIVSAAELLSRDIKPREMLLDPILSEQDLGMLYSPRGVGKTFVALGIGASVASGGRFLRWTAPRPRGVLLVDGELPMQVLQTRLAMILTEMEESEPAAGLLRIITPDLQDGPLPNLVTREGQHQIEEHLVGGDLLIVDNLSALCGASENDGEGWIPVQQWALGLRRRGVSILFIHHAGKSGSQRGSSRREDLLDIVMMLKRPTDYRASEGLRCEVHFEKLRSVVGGAAEPFEARMVSGPDGRAIWTCQELEDALADQAAARFSEGQTVREVAEELKISKSQAGRLRQRWSLERQLEASHCPSPKEDNHGTT